MAIRFKDGSQARRPASRPLGSPPPGRIPEEERDAFEAALRLDPEIARRFDEPPDADDARLFVTAEKAADGSAPVAVCLSSPNFFEDVPLEPAEPVLAILQALVDHHAPSWQDCAVMTLKIPLQPQSATLRGARKAQMAEIAKTLPRPVNDREIDW